jgi:drug/metabolite transporter (DMT)-like permease
VVTVLLALGSSACYGVSNFVGPLLARRETLFTVLFVSHLAALVGAAAYLGAQGGPALHGHALLIAGLAGAGNAGGLIGFYKAAELGPIAVAAPIGATGAAIPVAWGLAHGDTLTAVQAAGMVLALIGCVLAARRPAAPTDYHPDPRASIAWAAGSAIAFGTFLTALPAASEHGRAWALFDARLALLVIIVICTRPPGRELRELRLHPSTALLTLPGLLLLTGTLLYLFAAARGQLSLVSVLSSVAPVFTVGLSVVLMGDRPTPVQTTGVLAALAGVVLIAA